MKTCFVAQPFNSSIYEKRYQDTFVKAIEAAGLKPYRVDKDPSASIPIIKIEEEIREAAVFFVEISEDNPNVWLEFGLAHALNKEMVIVCDEKRRDKLPFDMQHRQVIIYKSESQSDFSFLQERITASLRSAIEKESKAAILGFSLQGSSQNDINDFEIALLFSIANEILGHDEIIEGFKIANRMEKIGYSRLGFNFAIAKLIKRNFVNSDFLTNFDGDKYRSYGISELGWNWIETNGILKDYTKSVPSKNFKALNVFLGEDDSDISF